MRADPGDEREPERRVSARTDRGSATTARLGFCAAACEAGKRDGEVDEAFGHVEGHAKL